MVYTSVHVVSMISREVENLLIPHGTMDLVESVISRRIVRLCCIRARYTGRCMGIHVMVSGMCNRGKDADGNTALHFTVIHDRREVADHLLSAGAAIDLQSLT